MTARAKINAALAAAGFNGEISKDQEFGIYYLAGDDFACVPFPLETCLHAVRLSDLTIDDVLTKARELRAAMGDA